MKKKINIIISFILIAIFIFAIFFFTQEGQLKYIFSDKMLSILTILLFMSAGVGIFSFVAPLFSKEDKNMSQEKLENNISSISSQETVGQDNIIVIREGDSSDFWKGFKFGLGFFFGFCFLALIISAFFLVVGISVFSGLSKSINVKNTNSYIRYK